MDSFNEYIRLRKKSFKLDPYKPKIDEWLEEKVKAKQWHTDRRIYKKLCKAYPVSLLQWTYGKDIYEEEKEGIVF